MLLLTKLFFLSRLYLTFGQLIKWHVQGFNCSQSNNMLILQESCIDSSGSLVVYCPVDLPAINIAMSGEDPSYIPLLPSGFTILPDGEDGGGGGTISSAASTSTSSRTRSAAAGGSGSLVTVVFQILVSSLPCAAGGANKMMISPESVATVNNLIATTIHQIKAALNCPPTTTNTATTASLWWWIYLLLISANSPTVFQPFKNYTIQTSQKKVQFLLITKVLCITILSIEGWRSNECGVVGSFKWPDPHIINSLAEGCCCCCLLWWSWFQYQY